MLFLTSPSSDSDAGFRNYCFRDQSLWPTLGHLQKGLSFPDSSLSTSWLPGLLGCPNTELALHSQDDFFPRCSLSNCSINSTPHLSFLRQLSNNSPFVLTSFLYLLRDSISPGPRSKSSLCQLMRSGCKSDQLGPCSASASSPVDRE